MKVLIGKNCELVDQMAQDWMHKEFNRGIRNFFIPAGGTPEGLYKLWREKLPKWVHETFLYQVDDIVDGEQKDKFYEFFNDHLGPYKNRLQRIGETKTPKDFSTFLGLGLNGHVAFHEPNLDDDFEYGEVELSETTRAYLKLKESKTGITYGLGTFLKSESILLMVKGKHKGEILTRFLKDDPTCPAISLKSVSDLTLVVDEEVWNLIDSDLKKKHLKKDNQLTNFFV